MSDVDGTAEAPDAQSYSPSNSTDAGAADIVPVVQEPLEAVEVAKPDVPPVGTTDANGETDTAAQSTSLPSRPPGPPHGAPPGAPPGGPPGAPPGPPPGQPTQTYAPPQNVAPVMRFGTYSAPPVYPHMGGGYMPPPSMMPNFPPPLPPGWSEHMAPDGLTRYYYNSQTRESTYSRPSFAPLPPPGFPQGFPPGVPPPSLGSAPPTAVPEKKKKKEKPKDKVLIPGTTWQRITTTEGNVFFFEKTSKRSEWSVPAEIAGEVAELEAEERKLKAEAERVDREAAEKERLEKLREQERIRAEVEAERKKRALAAAASAKRKQDEAAGATEDNGGEAKKAKLDVDEEGESKKGDEEEFGPQGDDDEAEWMKAVAAEFADADQAQQEKDEQERKTNKENVEEAAKQIFAVPQKVNVSVEEGRALFKALLLEKNISPFAPWDQSLPLFINDPRYILLASEKDRREVYEEHCRDIGRQRRLKKGGDTAASAETKKADPEKDYKALMREDVTSTRTRWEDWRRKWKKDRRFYGYGRDDRDREKAFKTHLKELGERKRADAQRAETDFYELLGEQPDITSSSVWAEVKRGISSDRRYDAVGSSSLRLELFEGYVRKLASGSSHETPEQAAERKAAERKARQEASLRERQAQVGQEKERVEREVGKSKAGAGREEGERVFGSLLVDQIRDHEITWNDAVRFLSSDPRYNHPSLHMGDKRRLYEAHIAHIASRRTNALHDLFVTHTPALDTPYDVVYPKVIDDPLVQRLGLDVNTLEERWNAWRRARETEARAEFQQMLGENSFVEFWGKMRKKETDEQAAEVLRDKEEEAVKVEGEDGEGLGDGGDKDLGELARQIDMNEIKAVLRRDKRYRQFDHAPEQREEWLKEYLENLSAASGSETIHRVGGTR